MGNGILPTAAKAASDVDGLQSTQAAGRQIEHDLQLSL